MEKIFKKNNRILFSVILFIGFLAGYYGRPIYEASSFSKGYLFLILCTAAVTALIFAVKSFLHKPSKNTFE